MTSDEFEDAVHVELAAIGTMLVEKNRAAPLSWGSVEWKRETPDVLTLRLTAGAGDRIARIPVEKGALVGAAAKSATPAPAAKKPSAKKPAAKAAKKGGAR